MDLEMLDGYLAGVLISPRPIAAERWMPGVWSAHGDEAGLRLARHYVLYPNPWPKIGHLGRRWHAHPVFPWIPRLGGVLECRSNWLVYIEEFALALEVAIGRPVAWEAFSAEVPLTPFERKYRDSGQTLYRLGVDLSAVDATKN